MNEQARNRPPVWFWVVSVLALVWNVMGCLIFLTEMFAQESMMESMTAVQKEWTRSIPVWVYAVFAVSVTSGMAGSIFLLLRRKLAVSLFAISVIAVLIQMVYTMLIAGGLQVMGPGGAVMPGVVVLLAIVWLVFSRLCYKRGWLG